MLKKVVITFIFIYTLVISYIHFIKTSETHNQCNKIKINKKSAINKIKKLSDTEIKEYLKEYLRLKNDDNEKYKRVDEILGKILLIFMADLGLKLDKDVEEFAKNTISQHNKDKRTRGRQKEEQKEDGGTTDHDYKTQAIHSSVDIMDRQWINNEKLINQIESETEITDFLNKTQIPNIKETLLSLNAIPYFNANKTLLKILGYFSGKLIQQNNGKEKEDITLPMTLSLENKSTQTMGDKLEYKIFIKNITTSEGETNLGMLIKTLQNSNSLILNLRGAYFILQLYYIESLDIIIGNVYINKFDYLTKKEKYMNYGHIYLERTND